jgi:hypothetical protein
MQRATMGYRCCKYGALQLGHEHSLGRLGLIWLGRQCLIEWSSPYQKPRKNESMRFCSLLALLLAKDNTYKLYVVSWCMHVN